MIDSFDQRGQVVLWNRACEATLHDLPDPLLWRLRLAPQPVIQVRDAVSGKVAGATNTVTAPHTHPKPLTVLAGSVHHAHGRNRTRPRVRR